METTEAAEAPKGTAAEVAYRVQDISRILGDYIGRLSRVWVEGQVVSARPYGRQVYITLRDTDVDMSMSVVVATDLFSTVEELCGPGARIVMLAQVEWTTKKGQIQLRASAIRPVGVGELLARIEALRHALDVEGLFNPDRKRKLPFLPRRIGLITGRDTDALKDVVINTRRRWPAIPFEIREIALQQQGTPLAAAAAMKELEAIPEVDVIIIARGGGSFEDLLPWSDEGLIRAVAACTKPVISAIGHENDRPILDDVADVRASTPTDAARKVVPDLDDESTQVQRAHARLIDLRRRWFDAEQRHVTQARATLRARSPKALVELRRSELQATTQQLRSVSRNNIERQQLLISAARRQLSALSPFRVLERGYAVVTSADGSVVRDQKQVTTAEEITIRLHQGQFTATRTDKESS